MNYSCAFADYFITRHRLLVSCPEGGQGPVQCPRRLCRNLLLQGERICASVPMIKPDLRLETINPFPITIDGVELKTVIALLHHQP